MEKCRSPWRARGTRAYNGGLGPLGSRGKAPGQGVLKLKALFYLKAARMLFSGPISTKYTSVSRYHKFVIIVHLMTLKSEVAELCCEVAELSSGELRLTFTTGCRWESWFVNLSVVVCSCVPNDAVPAWGEVTAWNGHYWRSIEIRRVKPTSTSLVGD